MSRCVVSVGVGSWYAKGVARLLSSLERVDGDKAEWLTFTSCLPPGSPSHAIMPYGFKIYALKEAARLGHDSLLWCDASCWAIRSLEPIWERIDRAGHLLMDCHNYLSQWSSDRSLAALNFKREEVFSVPLVTGGMFGFRLSHERGRHFFDWLCELATPEVMCGDWNNDHGQVSKDPRVRGHRHDQVVMGFIAERSGFPLIRQPEYFAYDRPDPDPKTIIVARGM